MRINSGPDSACLFLVWIFSERSGAACAALAGILFKGINVMHCFILASRHDATRQPLKSVGGEPNRRADFLPSRTCS